MTVDAFIAKQNTWRAHLHTLGYSHPSDPKTLIDTGADHDIGLAHHFGQGPALAGGCSGTVLCHFMVRKFAFNKDVTAEYLKNWPRLVLQ